MAHFMPSDQLQQHPQVADKLDVQIIKLCVKVLSSSPGNVESEQNLQAHVERCLRRKLKSSLLPLLQLNKNNFIVKTDGKIDFVTAFTKLELCPTHCSGRSNCPGAPCDKLHICKFYLLSNSCRIEKIEGKEGKLCTFGHDLTTAHNQALLREHYLDDLCVEEVRNIFRHVKSRCPVTMPQLCKFYTAEKGCSKEGTGQACPFIHLCKFYVKGSCTFNKRCRRSHDLLTQQVRDLLERYGINTERSPKEVLADLQNCSVCQADGSVSGSVQSSSPSHQTTSRISNMKRHQLNPNDLLAGFTNLPSNGSKDADQSMQSMAFEICIYYLREKCGFGKRCRRHHEDSMYQWQRKGTADEGWINFTPPQNLEIELKFCDVKTDKCCIDFGTDIVWEADFEKMDCEQKNTPSCLKRETLEIRRLTTQSSAVQKFHPLATQWKWYWKDQSGEWIRYGEQNQAGYKTTVDSESFEQNYQENPIGQMKFATMGHEYIMDFQRMFQKNIIHETERKVRRRPTFVESAEVERRRKQSANTGNTKTTSSSSVVPAPLNNNPLSYIPQNWSFDLKKGPDEISNHFNLVPCSSSSDEFKKIKKAFHSTMLDTAEIEQIKRVENGELLMSFVSKKEKMKRKKRVEEMSELQLFHGTNEELIDAISHQGFDFRLSGSKVGNKYGKGSYFAKFARTSDSYADFGVQRHMFVVRVLPGDYAPGNCSYSRPPRKTSDSFELYDSCVDCLQNPTIYVIFSFDQMYPEYVIEYRKNGI